MKCIIPVFLFMLFTAGALKAQSIGGDEHVFIITTDGLRWQEVFTGADSLLIRNEKFTKDSSSLCLQYWAARPEERRRLLMPFMWSVIAQRGQLLGNRHYRNQVNVRNPFRFSYAGYNEMLTGRAGLRFPTNRRKLNPNLNLLAALNRQEGFRGRVAAFSSWDVFPYILNSRANGLPGNSAYEPLEAETPTGVWLNRVQDSAILHKEATRQDQLTFVAAKEYIKQHRPRVLHLALGETDEFAHSGRYDLYLQQANAVDRMLADLWNWVQTDPEYRGKTTFIITTDHGRGNGEAWVRHGFLTPGSAQVWMALIGPQIPALGELKEENLQFQQQLPATVYNLLQLTAELPGTGRKPFEVFTGRPAMTIAQNNQLYDGSRDQ